ncbi:hypothetical protein AWV80_09195 [Cupriavidus sp. UYMU48A]|nr:hypothetical protein AWV80_09195 [Cupriavidus sp. UYMU48A]
MDSSPFSAQGSHADTQSIEDPHEISRAKVIVLTQFQRARRAMQVKHRLTSVSDYVHMCRPMIVWVDDHAQP